MAITTENMDPREIERAGIKQAMADLGMMNSEARKRQEEGRPATGFELACPAPWIVAESCPKRDGGYCGSGLGITRCGRVKGRWAAPWPGTARVCVYCGHTGTDVIGNYCHFSGACTERRNEALACLEPVTADPAGSLAGDPFIAPFWPPRGQ